MTMKSHGSLAGIVLVLLAIGANAGTTRRPPAGRIATPLPEQLRPSVAVSTRGVVVSGCPEASRAGAAILAAGGNAVDAAIAAALALGVAEPGQSGLGGQTYMLICLRDGRRVAVDGSCVAPLRVSRPALQRLAEEGRLFGPKLVAAPATLAALAHALERYGSMTLQEVLRPAIELADAGTSFTPNQRHFLDAYVPKIREDDYLANFFLQDRLFTWDLGHVYCQPVLASTLRRIAAAGAADFYTGRIAEEIHADMVARDGFVRLDDLARVRPSEREPLRGCYRGLEIVTFPQPGAGVALIEALNILERFPSEFLRGDGIGPYYLQAEAVRLAMADEQRLHGSAPEELSRLLGEAHAAALAALISGGRALAPQELAEPAGDPWRDRDTTHLSAADAAGTVVSLTQTLGHGFGASVATPSLGFAYNCMLEGFDYTSPASRSYLLPLKAPHTSMTPTVVFREGRPFLVLGSVGTSRIIPSLVQTIVNVVDRGMTLPEAIAAPRVMWGGDQENQMLVEVGGTVDEETVEKLRRRGYTNLLVRRFPLSQGDLGWQGCVNAIAFKEAQLVGVGDPRRQGTAAAPD